MITPITRPYWLWNVWNNLWICHLHVSHKPPYLPPKILHKQTWASLSFVLPGCDANSSQSWRSCSSTGHKQRCWTVLSELRYKVAYNPNTFFLNWRQRRAEKAVWDALQYIKMYVAGVWTKTAKGYFKNVENKSFDVRARFGAIYSASKTKKYLLKRSTIGNRLLFSELANIVRKIRTGGSFYHIVIYFWNSITISQLNFERLLVTDFCSNNFSEISLIYLLYQ